MKKAFTLVEILIVVAILGILAAITLPTFRGHIAEAKESAAKDNLRILRNAIELYAAQHDGVPPGYPYNDPTEIPNSGIFIGQIVISKYIKKIPANPFNNQTAVRMIKNGEDLPLIPTENCGWIYQPQTKITRLSWPGTDSKGVYYYDY